METIELDDPPCQVRLSRSPRARRFTLRMAPAGNGAILTTPPGVPHTECRSFLERHRTWLERAVARQPAVIDIVHGSRLPVDGVLTEVVTKPGRRQPAVLVDDKLVIHGPGATGPRVATWLKERARAQLCATVNTCADRLGVTVTRIALRDTTSRWGSCSSRGTLSFSWRIAMAPRPVQDYLATHEAAHLVEMNHSSQFWALVEHLMPDWRTHRDWLRREGRTLHSYRFDRE